MSYANPTTPTDYIDSLKWGTAASAGAAKETVATLGDARASVRIPPSTAHTDGLQLARFHALLLGMSEYLNGGNRLRILANTALNQFAAAEHGFQVNNPSGSNFVPQFVPNGGTPQNIASGATTAKGDLLPFGGTVFVVLPVGSNGQFLKANSATSSGMEWGAAGINTIGNANPTQQTVQTTDATWTTIYTYTPVDGEAGTVQVIANAQGIDVGAGPTLESTGLFLNCTYRRSGGAVTRTGNNKPDSVIGDRVGYDIQGLASGGDLLIQVKGSGGHTVDWIAGIEILKQV